MSSPRNTHSIDGKFSIGEVLTLTVTQNHTENLGRCPRTTNSRLSYFQLFSLQLKKQYLVNKTETI